jgi:hypothetical protein
VKLVRPEHAVDLIALADGVESRRLDQKRAISRTSSAP